jgi:hypothetical protein
LEKKCTFQDPVSSHIYVIYMCAKLYIYIYVYETQNAYIFFPYDDDDDDNDK